MQHTVSVKNKSNVKWKEALTLEQVLEWQVDQSAGAALTRGDNWHTLLSCQILDWKKENIYLRASETIMNIHTCNWWK